MRAIFEIAHIDGSFGVGTTRLIKFTDVHSMKKSQFDESNAMIK